MNEIPNIYEVCFGGIYTIIEPKDIVYVYSARPRCILVMQNGETHKCRKKLDELEEELEKIYPAFARVAKSILVNCNFIKQYNNEHITIKNGETFTIGRSSHEKWITQFQKWKNGVA